MNENTNLAKKTAFAEKVDGMLERSDMTRADLADAVGIKLPTMNYYIDLNPWDIRANQANVLCRVLGCSVDELYDGVPAEPSPAHAERGELLAEYREGIGGGGDLMVATRVVLSVSEKLALCISSAQRVCDGERDNGTADVAYGVFETLRGCHRDLEELEELLSFMD